MYNALGHLELHTYLIFCKRRCSKNLHEMAYKDKSGGLHACRCVTEYVSGIRPWRRTNTNRVANLLDLDSSLASETFDKIHL